MKKLGFLGTFLLVSSALSFQHQLASAEKCNALLVVGGQNGETLVNKRVSAPRVPIGAANLKRDNWNTDFSVSSDSKYQKFVTTLNPKNDGIYSIKMYLKYSDGTADEVYKNKPKLSANKPLIISGNPRTNQQPYQVNIFVGDVESVGKSYDISVKACQ